MRKFVKKLRSLKGESFIEVMIAVLIVALGCLMVATMYSSAFNSNSAAKAKDNAFYEALSGLEQSRDGTDDMVQISDKRVDIFTGAETEDSSTDVNVKKYEGEGMTSFDKGG